MKEPSVGVVVIGRNEGERLRASLAAVMETPARVYVDSGSTDGSCSLARSLGFDVVELAKPPDYTAARARKAGVKRLLTHWPGLVYIQTIDGDCELRPGWLDLAQAELEADPRRAVVFGRRRERQPRRNAYHSACDAEWTIPVGEVPSCGGDALFRVAALEEVGGYNPALIAGEEPDLCLRMRQRGWLVWSNGHEMTLHDVDMRHFSQWWHRSRRTGYAFAQLVDIHGVNADSAWQRLLLSALTWSGVALVALVASMLAVAMRDPLPVYTAILLGALLVLQLVRLALMQQNRVDGFDAGLKWAWLIMIAKIAQGTGWALYKVRRVTRAQTPIIEYKR